MPFDATGIRIMIAAPSDAEEECKVVRKVIEEWNQLHAESSGTFLYPKRWDTHATPEHGDRAQEIINRTVLKDCDLLIAVFRNRLGMPTGKDISGTVEELTLHTKAGKPAMVYFCTGTVPRSLTQEQQEQLDKLKEFQKACDGLGLNGRYQDESDLYKRLPPHLHRQIIGKFSAPQGSAKDAAPVAPASAPEEKAMLKELWKPFLKLREQCGDIMPSADYAPPEGKEWIDVYSKRYDDQYETLRAAYRMWTENSPFMPKDISNLCENIINVARKVNVRNRMQLHMFKRDGNFDKPERQHSEFAQLESEIKKLSRSLEDAIRAKVGS